MESSADDAVTGRLHLTTHIPACNYHLRQYCGGKIVQIGGEAALRWKPWPFSYTGVFLYILYRCYYCLTCTWLLWLWKLSNMVAMYMDASCMQMILFCHPHSVVKVVLWSRGLNWRSQVGAKPIPIPTPTNLALFGHKITLYRFNQGAQWLIYSHTIAGAQIGAGG